jgi:hypothetical protein
VDAIFAFWKFTDNQTIIQSVPYARKQNISKSVSAESPDCDQAEYSDAIWQHRAKFVTDQEGPTPRPADFCRILHEADVEA